MTVNINGLQIVNFKADINMMGMWKLFFKQKTKYTILTFSLQFWFIYLFFSQ